MKKPSPIVRAAHAHTDLNIFAALQSILEGGGIYTQSGQRMASRINRLCQQEQQRQLRAYDAAVRENGK